jgi:DNA processing protein
MNRRGLLDLIISLLPGLRAKDRISLVKGFDHEEDFVIQSKRDIEEYLKHEIKTTWDLDVVRAKAERIEVTCRIRSIEWISWAEADYPPLLRECYDPPAVIYYRGKLPDPEKSLLGMVGTRKPTPEAASQAYMIASEAAQAGISVLSGLALGIDAISHRGNLSGGIPGYAVLGSGADEIYPSANRMLAKRILESGGAIISEYTPGTRPFKGNFPARNRIIAALSRSVIIVEAPQKSGSLITADFALEQGKDLWVASSGVQKYAYGSPEKKLGTIKLADDGADIIYSARDVLIKWNNITECGSDMAVTAHCDTGKKEIAVSMANILGIDL